MKIDVKHEDTDGNEIDNSMAVFVLKCSLYAILLFIQVLGVYLIWNSVVIEVFPMIKQIDALQAFLLLCLVQIFRVKL